VYMLLLHEDLLFSRGLLWAQIICCINLKETISLTFLIKWLVSKESLPFLLSLAFLLKLSKGFCFRFLFRVRLDSCSDNFVLS